MLTGSEELLKVITENFGYLVEAYKFKPTVYLSLSKGRSLWILESKKCCFKFTQNQSDIDVTVGTPSAPYAWDDKANGRTVWHPVEYVIDYLLKRPVDVVALLQDDANDFPSSEQLLAQLGMELQPLVEQVIEIFRSDAHEQRAAYVEVQRRWAKQIEVETLARSSKGG